MRKLLILLLVVAALGPAAVLVDELDASGKASKRALDTRVGSLNLTGRGHPSPTEDAVDTAILTAAAAD